MKIQENSQKLEKSTVFPRICVRNRGNGACTKSESKVHISLFRKNRAVSYISACHCKDPTFSYQFDTIEWPILSPKHAFLGVFRDFEPN